MQQQVNKLKKQIEPMLADLQNTSNASVSLIRACGLLTGALKSFAKQNFQTGIAAAKEACEDLVDRAGQAYTNGDDALIRAIINWRVLIRSSR